MLVPSSFCLIGCLLKDPILHFSAPDLCGHQRSHAGHAGLSPWRRETDGRIEEETMGTPTNHPSGQIITTSAEVTLNGGLIRELPQNPLNSGFRNYTNLPRSSHILR